MTPNQAQSVTKKISKEINSLEPSALITLYEIDLSQLILRGERVVYSDQNLSTELRFHNNLKSINTSIWFNGKEYFPAPISATGFETSAKGSPPSPRLSIASNPKGLSDEVRDRVKYIKYAIRDLDNLSGAKVKRIRTFVKYIDNRNFYKADGTTLISSTSPAPEGFDPDPNATFPEDVYVIDRKSGENKNTLEFELASPFDVHDLKLPGRIVTEVNCVWIYRGEGCCYEYDSIKNNDLTSKRNTAGEYEHDSIYYNNESQCKSAGDAPPIATYKNENILDLISVSSLNPSTRSNASQDKYVAGAEWNNETQYVTGDFCRVLLNGVNYYFVAKASNKGAPPPNSAYWIADECSKTISGCKKRWANPIPIGAFPTSRRGGTS